MARITEIKVKQVYEKDLNQQHWWFKGICVCGQEVEDEESGEVHKILINIAVTVCTTCEAEARD